MNLSSFCTPARVQLAFSFDPKSLETIEASAFLEERESYGMKGRGSLHLFRVRYRHSSHLPSVDVLSEEFSEVVDQGWVRVEAGATERARLRCVHHYSIERRLRVKCQYFPSQAYFYSYVCPTKQQPYLG